MHEGPMTKTRNLTFNGHPSLWGGVGRIEGVLTPPLHQLFYQKEQKPCRHCQAALRRLLATLPAIGRIFALNLDHTHPQGVH